MIHYLILVHNNLDQLELLVKKIKTKNSKIYIHIDKKVKIFEKLKDVYYIEDRQNISWGGTKMLDAELIGLSEIYKNMKKGDHAVIISGQCFPIKTINYIENYINGFGNKSCIDYRKAFKDVIKNRITSYSFYDTNFHIPKQINKLFIKFLSYFRKFDTNIKVPVINIVIGKIISFFLPKRTYLVDKYTIYWGCSWMVLSYTHIKFLLNFLRTEDGENVLKNFNCTANNDEVFFQTILVNNRENEIINDCLWYIVREKGRASPKILTIDNLKEIKESNKIFGRKFDITKDKKIIDTLCNL